MEYTELVEDFRLEEGALLEDDSWLDELETTDVSLDD